MKRPQSDKHVREFATGTRQGFWEQQRSNGLTMARSNPDPLEADPALAMNLSVKYAFTTQSRDRHPKLVVRDACGPAAPCAGPRDQPTKVVTRQNRKPVSLITNGVFPLLYIAALAAIWHISNLFVRYRPSKPVGKFTIEFQNGATSTFITRDDLLLYIVAWVVPFTLLLAFTMMRSLDRSDRTSRAK